MCATALGLLASVVSAQSQGPAPGGRIVERHPQQPRADQVKRQAAGDQRGTEQAPLVVKTLPPAKTDAEAAQETQDRESEAANQRHARFVGYATLVALVMQLFVFGYQATQLRGTVRTAGDQSRQMKRSVDEAARAATAMERLAESSAASADAAAKSLAMARERSAQQMRAYITVIIGAGVYQERDKSLRFAAKPIVLNTGHTPAHRVRYRARAGILPQQLPDDFAFPLPKESEGGAVLGPQQQSVLSAMLPDFVDDAEVDDIKRANGKALYAWGVVTYDDVFGETHTTKFCQIVTWLADDRIWGYYPTRHNEAD